MARVTSIGKPILTAIDIDMRGAGFTGALEVLSELASADMGSLD